MLAGRHWGETVKDEPENFQGQSIETAVKVTLQRLVRCAPGQDKEKHQCSRDQLTREKGGTPGVEMGWRGGVTEE